MFNIYFQADGAVGGDPGPSSEAPNNPGSAPGVLSGEEQAQKGNGGDGLMHKDVTPPTQDGSTPPEEKDPEKPSVDGERPENIPEKFWDAEKKSIKTDSLVKSYTDLEKQYGKLKNDKQDPVPESVEDYTKDFKMPALERKNGEETEKADRIAAFEKDDPALQGFAKAAKNHGLSKKQFDGMLGDMLFEFNGLMPEPYDEKAEMDALGGESKALAVIDINQKWLNRLEKTNTIDAEEKNFLMDLGGTALGIRTLNKIRQQTGEKHIPVHTVVSGNGNKTRDELYALRDHEDWNSKDDSKKKAYRQYVDSEYNKSFPNG